MTDLNPEAFIKTADLGLMFQRLNEQISLQPEDESPAVVLAGCLNITKADGTEKTAAEIAAATAERLSQPDIVADLAKFNEYAQLLAQACLFHMHGQELANSFELNGIVNHGLSLMEHDHDHGDKHLFDDDDDKDSDTGKKKAKRVGGLFANFTIISPKKPAKK